MHAGDHVVATQTLADHQNTFVIVIIVIVIIVIAAIT